MLRSAISRPGFEPAVRRAIAVGRQRRLKIVVGHRPAIRAARQRRDDLSSRTRPHRRLPRRSAGRAKPRAARQDAPAARRIANRCRRRLRAGDRHAGNFGLAAAGPVGISTQRRVEQVFDERRGLRGEVHLHQMRAGLHRHAELQQLEDLLVAVLARIVARLRRRRRHAVARIPARPT